LGVLALKVMVSVAEAGLAPRVSEGGENEQFAPAGRPELHAKVT
jgi:hypothetical protein